MTKYRPLRPARAASLSALLPLIFLASISAVDAADTPSVKLALSFRPVQKGVVHENPRQADYPKCRVEVERKGKTSGWIVFGPGGQVLRRFVDTNADNVVDQWRYYHRGLEVYRDIDTDFNNKVDQCRWLNSGGTKWGIDRNEDGEIDEWKVISAAETSFEAIAAMAANDAKRLSRILITAADLRSLGVTEKIAQKILAAVATPAATLRQRLAKSNSITAATRWLRFNGSKPGLIPADAGIANRDLTVYENAIVIVETGKKSGLVQIGEMVRVGATWKLTQIPLPLDDNLQVTAGGLLMQPELASIGNSGGAPANALSPQMQKLLGELQMLDKNAPKPNAGARMLAIYNAQRADLIEKLVLISKTDNERDQWTRQLVDGLAAAVQSGQYPAGLKRLESLQAKLILSRGKSSLVPYVVFRRLLAEYTVKLQNSPAQKRAEIQKWWLTELQRFTVSYPKSQDAADAMLQLAISLEFSGKTADAKTWYRKLIAAQTRSSAKERATGALRRLELVGKLIKFSGPGLTGGRIDAANYRGKVLLVAFWSTWCKPCTEDLPQLKALYAKYRGQGFEILGVNLDVSSDPVKPYLARHGVTWAQIHQDGGLESEPGRDLGIISLPTMILVDRKGKVVSRSVSVQLLKQQLSDLLKE